MEFIKSLPSLAKEAFTAMSETLVDDFKEMAPIEYGSWHWRSVIVMTGLTCSLTSFVISLFYSSALITFTSLIATAILTFALYYVSRFEEQRRMALLLDDFEENNERLQEQVDTLKEENSRLETTRKEIEVQVVELTATKKELQGSLATSEATAVQLSSTNQELSSTLATIQEREKALAKQHEEYVRAHREGARDIAANISSLRDLDSQCGDKQRELRELSTRMQGDLEQLGAIRAEVMHLQDIRSDLGTHVQSLKEQVRLLQQGAQTHSLNQTALSALVSRVESILATHSS